MEFNSTSKTFIQHDQAVFNFREPRMIQHIQIKKCQIKRMKDKNHITSIDAEKAFNKI
jgi:hypothetical protein